MKKFKNLLALSMIAMLSLSVIGCNSDSEKDDDDKKSNKSDVSAESVLESIDTEEINNFAATMDFVVDACVEAEGESMDIVFNINMDMQYDETLSYIKMDMEADADGESNEMNMEIYTETTDDEVTVYFCYDDIWYYQTMDVSEFSMENSETLFFTDYITDSEIIEDDDDTYVIECTIDFAKLYKDQADAIEDSLATEDMDEYLASVEEMFDSLDEIEVVYEIDKESNMINSVKMDLTDSIENILDSLTELSESEVDYSEMIKINEVAFDFEYENYDDTEVEIPDEVIDDAIDSSDIGGEYDDDNGVDISGDQINIYDYYSEEQVATITLPEGFSVDTEYSDKYSFSINDDNFNTFYIDTIIYYEIDEYLNGEFEADLENYTRDEFVEYDSIETNQGTVRVFANVWSMNDDYETSYFIDYYCVLYNNDTAVLSIDYYAYNDDSTDYSQAELGELIKEMLQ